MIMWLGWSVALHHQLPEGVFDAAFYRLLLRGIVLQMPKPYITHSYTP
jgi:hypothetical protein